MTDQLQVVGRVGAASLHLIGGPLDGVTKWGVVGSALTIRLRKPKSVVRQSGLSLVWFGTSGPIEGDEWKQTDAQGVTRHYQHYAIYTPVVQGGKATDRVAFEGILAVEVPVPKVVTPPPAPEYEAAEDEDTDDD